ncbi:histidine--tRNA ligase [Candidatus Saccharibacteria bacterium]|nr:MAG: histidine--tRNA ligase [Candidatus Saccharibacteria bacterium]
MKISAMTSLNYQPYKGTRDYYPADKRVQNYIFGVWREVAERFGYEEYSAPLLEPIDLYAAKSGQEIVNEQTYQFTDRGGRNVAIRPEMTPSISRMVAAQRQELGYPARLYSIAQFMRYERPQHGREREFWQLNLDMFGVEGAVADAEIIIISDAIMRSFGATNKMYTIRINNRQLINFMMADYLGLDVIQSELMIKLFDRKNKITPEQFDEQARDIFAPEQQATGMSRINVLLNASSMAELPPELRDSEPVREVAQLFTQLQEAGVTTAKFDISLMRGFDYYTGMVFEVFDNHPDNNRSMFGGGRYDGLVGLFGVEPVPTVGVAPGATTTENFLRAHDLLPKFESTTDVYLIVLGEGTLKGAQKVAAALRAEGVKIAVDITHRKLDKQIKAAVKMRVPYMLFIGEQELTDELYRLKDVKSEDEQTLGLERIVTTVADYRRRKSDDDF